VKSSYYYDPPGSMNIVEKPGFVCDWCGLLAEMGPLSEGVPMPCQSIDEEYGRSAGDIFMHANCALECYEKQKQELEEMERALKARNLI